MKLLIKKERKKYLKDLGREVSVQKPDQHLVRETDKDFHTKFGIIKKEFFNSEDGAKFSVGNQEYTLLTPTQHDLYKRIKREAQIIPLKDIGSIITFTGLNKDSVVLDAGCGSGGISLFLASIVKKVKTFDIKEENVSIVRENIKSLGLDNVEANLGSIYELNVDSEFDCFTLDVPEPWEAVETAEKALKIGGYLVCYSPCIPPLSKFLEKVKEKENFTVIKTIEIIERDWEFDGDKVRPKSQQIGHSGFLSFVRKI